MRVDTRPPALWPVALLLAALVLEAAAAGFWFRGAWNELRALTDLRSETRINRLVAEKTLSALKDMETGVRGFQLTGDDNYLQPWHEGRAALNSQLALLRQRQPALPGGVSWAELDGAVAARESLLARGIEARQRLGSALPLSKERFEEGRLGMDRLRQLFGRMDQGQRALIDDIERRIARQRQHTVWAAWLMTGVALLATVLTLALVAQGRRRQQRLAEALQADQARLEQRVAERTAALSDAQQRLAGFARRQQEAVEQERRHLAREVHDQLGQVFSALKLITASLPLQQAPPGQAAALAQALELGSQATRRITAQLRPPLLDDLGLAAALQHHLEGLQAAHGLGFTLQLQDEARLDAERQIALFRILQEGLSNVLRHAGARQVQLRGGARPGLWRLTLDDDGRGPSPGPRRPGALGQLGMEERAALLGGRCRFERGPLGGTPGGLRVVIEWPLEEEQA